MRRASTSGSPVVTPYFLADSDFDGKITVTAVVEETFTDEVSILKEQIQLVNLPEKIKGQVKDAEKEITITLTGLVSAQSLVKEDDIKAKVDVLSYMNEHNMIELEPGIHEMDIQLELPEGVWMEENVQIPVEILK